MALDLEIKIYQGADQPKTYKPVPFSWDVYYILAHYPFKPYEDYALDFIKPGEASALDYIMTFSAAEFRDWINELLEEETIREDDKDTIKRISNRYDRKDKIEKVEIIVAEWDSGFDD